MTTNTEHPRRNGVDTTTLFATLDAVKSDPDLTAGIANIAAARGVTLTEVCSTRSSPLVRRRCAAPPSATPTGWTPSTRRDARSSTQSSSTRPASSRPTTARLACSSARHRGGSAAADGNRCTGSSPNPGPTWPPGSRRRHRRGRCVRSPANPATSAGHRVAAGRWSGTPATSRTRSPHTG